MLAFFGLSTNAQNKKHHLLPLPNNSIKQNHTSSSRDINTLLYRAGKEEHSSWDATANAWLFWDTVLNKYNSFGNIILKLAYDYTLLNNNKTVYVYNGNGNETSDTSMYWDGTAWVLNHLNSYIYDVNGNLTEQYAYYNWNNGTNLWNHGSNRLFTYDVNNNLTELINQDWNGSSWDNIGKFVYTWSGGQLTVETSQTWNGTWANVNKYEYAYVNGKVNERTGYSWNGSTWKNETKHINMVWHQWYGILSEYSSLTSYIYQVPDGPLWKDTIKGNFTYDSFGNQTDYLEQSKPATTYVTTYEQKDILQYNANNNIIEDIEQHWDNTTSTLINYYKTVYSQYQIFTGLNELAKGDNMIVYPDPNDGKFHVSSLLDVSKVEVYNVVGECVWSSTSSFGAGTDGLVDISDQAKGIYFVMITGENKNVVSKKMIVQ